MGFYPDYFWNRLDSTTQSYKATSTHKDIITSSSPATTSFGGRTCHINASPTPHTHTYSDYWVRIVILRIITLSANVILFWITHQRVDLWTTVLLMLVRCMAHVSIRVETLLEMKIQFLLDLLATLLAKNPQHQCYHLSSTYTKKKLGKNLAKTNVLLCCDNQCLLCPFFQHAWRRT